MKRKHCRRMAALFAAVMLLSAFPGGGGTGVYHLYKRSAEALFSGGRWLQRYGKGWLYMGLSRGNRL